MAPKVLLLTGPPPPSSVVEASCTIAGFGRPFLDLFDVLTITTTAAVAAPSATPTQYTAWRSLTLTRQPLHTGLTQAHVIDTSTLSNDVFFTTADATALGQRASGETTAASHDLLTQFCERSVGLHTVSGDADSQSLADYTESFATSMLSEDGQDGCPRLLSDLKDVPSAKKVTSLEPQTMTLNIIVGVLSVAQPRTVTTRWGSALSLIEVLVGDDTAAGFAVTFWVPRDKVAESDVVALRRQDVVLLENVALHVFQNKVYGQSLRRGLTKLHLLWRADGSGYYSSRSLRARGDNLQRKKTRTVRDWVIRFVGSDPQARRRTNALSWDRPPDDSQ